MAATEWILTDWTIAQWVDEGNTPMIFFLWEALKAASDERQAFVEQVFNTSFDADKEFPDFGLTGITLAGTGGVNNIDRVVNALNHTSGTKFDFVKTDTIKADGTTVAASALADYLDLGEILTDVLSYADDELLIALDTDGPTGPGSKTGIWQMAWLKQLYEAMNYPQYYARQIINTTDSFFSVIETQRMVLSVTYDYNTTLPTPVTLVRANYTNPPNATVDLYVTNDLNETAPFSTPQDIYDYTELTYDGQVATADWESATTVLNNLLFSQATMSMALDGAGEGFDNNADIEQRRVRFKVNENKRAESPDTYLAVLKFYFFLFKSNVGPTYNNFGNGINEAKSKLITLTPDINDYYYLEPTTAPDFTNFNVPAQPTAGNSVTLVEENKQQSLNEFTNVSNPDLSTHRTDILIEANNTDGTAFEYYTPA